MWFQVKAFKQGELPVWQKIEAPTVQAARSKADLQGWVVLQIRPLWTEKLATKSAGKFQLLLFCQEFCALFDAGLSVVEVLQLLLEKEDNSAHQPVLQSILAAVQDGMTLSQAMAMQADAFPALFIGTVAAAETSGNVTEAMRRYATYLASIELLKKKVVSATLYPAIVLAIGLSVLLFLLVFVIPKFSTIYQTQVKTISFSTQCLLSLANFSHRYLDWFMLLGALVIGVLLAGWRAGQWGTWLERMLWHVPYASAHARVYFLSRFYRTFSMLLKSGIPVVYGLQMVEGMLGERLKPHLRQAKQMIEEGQSFTHAMQQCGLTTPVALRLCMVGEKTGDLGSMMERAADFHEDAMARDIDHFSKIFEPVLMALLGCLIGGIVLMMYLPIFELATGLE